MTKYRALPLRSEVPTEQTWDLNSVFVDEDAWEAAYQEVSQLITNIEGYRGRLAEGTQVLLAFLNEFDKLFRVAGKVIVYAILAAAADATDQASAARSGQARSLYAQAEAAVSFLDPELMEIGFDTLREWIAESSDLAFLRQYINGLERLSKHVRGADVEQTIALASDAMSTGFLTYSVLTSADMNFVPATNRAGETLEVGQSSIDGLIEHPEREVRKAAWENYADGYLAYKNTLANTLLGAVKADVFIMRSRNYATSLEASLGPDFVPPDVFYNLLDVFKRNLPTWHRYWAVRRKALKYEKLHVYDIKAPLVGNSPLVSFEQAVDWISEGMAPLGEEYVSVLRRGCLEERWVDYVQNKGKRQGAFSSGTNDTYPFILMSNADNLYSLSTLAHELGHSMHSYYTWQNQPLLYSNYSLFVAEVASNFNQALVRDYLFKTQSDRDFQITLIEEAMSNFHRYFFIMPTLARFELEVHTRVENGAPVNAASLIDLTADLFKEGYGDEVEFDHDRIGITWAQFGHMYRNFYVYQYATGIAGAQALADQVIAGDGAAVERYLNFLKAGSSMYPLDCLKMAGVDLTSPEPVEKAFDSLAEMVSRLEKLVG